MATNRNVKVTLDLDTGSSDRALRSLANAMKDAARTEATLRESSARARELTESGRAAAAPHDARSTVLEAQAKRVTAEQDARTRVLEQRTALAVAPLMARVREVQAQTAAQTAVQDTRTRLAEQRTALKIAPVMAEAREIRAEARAEAAPATAQAAMIDALRSRLTAKQDAETDLLRGRTALMTAKPEADLRQALARRAAATAPADAMRALRAETSGFTAAQSRAHATAGTMHTFGLSGMAGETSRFANMGAGLEQMGFARGGAMLSRGGPWLAAAEQALKSASAVAEAYHNPYTTTAQDVRNLYRGLPGGETVFNTMDAFSGRKAGMQRTDVYEQHMGLDRQAAEQQRAYAQQFNIRQTGLEHAAAQAATAKPIVAGPIDRTTAGGEREYRERSRMVPVERELARSRREQAAADAQDQVAKKQLADLTTRQVVLEGRRVEKLREIAEGEQSGVDRVRMLKELSDLESQLQAGTGEIRGARETAAGTRTAAAQARRQTVAGEVQVKETEAATYEERAQTSAGIERTLGGMNVFDRRFAVQALKDLQEYGPDRIAPEALSAAQQVAPQTAGKIVEKFGAGTEEAAEIQRLAPGEYTGRSEDLRQKSEAAKLEGQKIQTRGDVEFTQAAAAAGKDLGETISAGILQMADSAKREIENRLRIGASQN